MCDRYVDEFRKLQLHEKVFISGKVLIMMGGGLITISKLMEVLIMKNLGQEPQIEFSTDNTDIYREEFN